MYFWITNKKCKVRNINLMHLNFFLFYVECHLLDQKKLNQFWKRGLRFLWFKNVNKIFNFPFNKELTEKPWRMHWKAFLWIPKHLVLMGSNGRMNFKMQNIKALLKYFSIYYDRMFDFYIYVGSFMQLKYSDNVTSMLIKRSFKYFFNISRSFHSWRRVE